MNCIKVSRDFDETALLFRVFGEFREYVIVECPKKRLLCTVVSTIAFSMNSTLLKNNLF